VTEAGIEHYFCGWCNEGWTHQIGDSFHLHKPGCPFLPPPTDLHADPQGEKPDNKGTPSGAETGHSASPQSCKSSKSAIQDQEL
jgi:hypothetical protein